jgi:hypothetical protein
MGSRSSRALLSSNIFLGILKSRQILEFAKLRVNSWVNPLISRRELPGQASFNAAASAATRASDLSIREVKYSSLHAVTACIIPTDGVSIEEAGRPGRTGLLRHDQSAGSGGGSERAALEETARQLNRKR